MLIRSICYVYMCIYRYCDISDLYFAFVIFFWVCSEVFGLVGGVCSCKVVLSDVFQSRIIRTPVFRLCLYPYTSRVLGLILEQNWPTSIKACLEARPCFRKHDHARRPLTVLIILWNSSILHGVKHNHAFLVKPRNALYYSKVIVVVYRVKHSRAFPKHARVFLWRTPTLCFLSSILKPFWAL